MKLFFRCVAACAALSFLCTLPVVAQTQTLASGLVAARSTIFIQNGTLAGSGLQVLTTALDQAKFVAIGEDHFTQQIPLFATAVCREMAPKGLTSLALETSPAAAAFVTRTLGTANRREQMAELQRRFPWSIAFLNVQEENDFVENCFEATPGKNLAIWGLDQDFEGSAGWTLERMMQSSPGPKSRAAIAVMQHDEQAAGMEAVKTGNDAKLYLFSSTDAQMQSAGAAIKVDGTPSAQKMFEGMEQSRDIYKKQLINPPIANLDRITLLDQAFLANYHAASQSPSSQRILVKLGDTHMYRGMNEMHQLNLGDFLAELANGEGAQSLHIMVLGVEGEHVTYGPYGKPPVHFQAVTDQDASYRWLKAAVDARSEVAPDGPWTMYDLRQLRYRRLEGLTPDWERVIYGYDFLVLIPRLTPAHLLQ